MKHSYQQYKFKLLKHASGPDKNPVHYDPTIYGMRLQTLLKEHNAQQEQIPGAVQADDDDVLNVLIFTNAEHAIWRGEGIHSFIDPDTEAVINRAIEKLDNKTLARYRPKNLIGVLYRANKDPILYNYSSDDGKSAGINMESLGIFRMDDLGQIEWGSRGNRDTSPDESLNELRDAMRFTSGCFMMQECFPDVFVDGLPDFVKHPSWFKKLNARAISVDRVEREVCPHIRRGHFRLLSDDRYVHKKGQVVFVKSSMVKGKAKHTELEELNAKSKKK